jgi:hypothetical protein
VSTLFPDVADLGVAAASCAEDALLATLLCATAGAAARTTRVLWGHRHRNPEDHRFFLRMDEHFETRLLRGPGARFLVHAYLPELLRLARRFGGDDEQQPDVQDALPGAREQDHRSGDVSVYLSTRRDCSVSPDVKHAEPL